MMRKTLTEKRFFEWHEDDVSVTLRCSSASYGGGSEVLSVDGTDSISGEKDMDATVRRLTPIECERLQGFPDNWTLIGEPEEVEVKDYKETLDADGKVIGKELIGTHKEIEYFYTDENGKRKKCSDSARYKALGNSIAVGYENNQRGFWMVLMKRISAQYERSATLGSLFDGIAGFPLAWARYNGPENCRWASEIEPFPIAVCKKHFGDEETGEKGDVKDYM